MRSLQAPADARITYVWILTSGLTILAWVLAAAHNGRHLATSTPEALAVLAIAAVKARYIVQHFMDVRAAPRWLRRFTDCWIVGLWATLLAMYLY